MSTPEPNCRIYATDIELSSQDKAAQIRHLAKIGIAASQSDTNIRDLDTAFISLFEVMYRLAEEVEDDIDGLRRAA